MKWLVICVLGSLRRVVDWYCMYYFYQKELKKFDNHGKSRKRRNNRPGPGPTTRNHGSTHPSVSQLVIFRTIIFLPLDLHLPNLQAFRSNTTKALKRNSPETIIGCDLFSSILLQYSIYRQNGDHRRPQYKRNRICAKWKTTHERV